MTRRIPTRVITANRLFEGDTVWFTAAGTWSPVMAEACLYPDQAAAEAALPGAAATPGPVVGAYVIEAEAGPNGPEPVHFREAFRARGPSNYPHGKTAGRSAA